MSGTIFKPSVRNVMNLADALYVAQESIPRAGIVLRRLQKATSEGNMVILRICASEWLCAFSSQRNTNENVTSFLKLISECQLLPGFLEPF